MRTITMAVMAMALAGCGNAATGGGDGGADLAVAMDLAVPDLSLHLGAADLAFGTDTDGGVACTPPPTASVAKYVWNAVTLPMQRTDFAFDLNNDGRTDNQYGNIVGALVGQGLDPQAAATQSITSGQSLTLLDEQAGDPTFTTATCAVTTMYAGVAMSSPDFSGSGHFMIDPAATVGHFFGPIAAARFTSEPPPANAKVPSLARINLALFGATPVDIIGARITYLRGANGSVTGGQLNGAIRQYDVDHSIVPGLAATWSAEVQANPSSSTSMQLLAIFDNGGAADAACGGTCKNLDGSCAVAHDNVISDCEVGTAGLIKNLLAPDVQMFDDAGNYHPQPANTKKDSLSIGLAFTAVPATF
ncbi:MAG: hypothetical protein ACXVCV_00060 [Polyangia bacterium]